MDASDRRKRVAEEAAEWWVLLQGDASRGEREHYVDWLRESPVHIAEMLRVAKVHGALDQFQRWSGIPIDGSCDEGVNVVKLPASEPRAELRRDAPERGLRRRAVRWSMAAMLIVVTGLAAVLLMHSQGRTIQTDRGERREVALADGSVIQVDPETRLRIKYEEHVRRIFLEHGRAMFHVAKNSERPFLVEANDTTVRAVGTAFAVEQQENKSILVTVAEGKVAVFPRHPTLTLTPAPPLAAGSAETSSKVSTVTSLHPSTSISSQIGAPRGAAKSASAQLSNGSAPELFLTANQQVSVARSGSAEAVHAVDSGRALAWADGRLIFENSSVGDAVQQFNRYNRIQIVINDPDLSRRSVSGVFNVADPESFAAFIQSVARVRITHTDGADITLEPVK